MMRARVARFYGFSPSEIEKMPILTFSEYFQCIGKLEAQEMMMAYKIQDWPNMKDKARSNEWSKLEKAAGFRSNKEAKRVTNDELRAILGSF